MRPLPARGATGTLVAEPEDLITRLSEDLERTIAFAEECRWRFPELRRDADALAADAMALFGKTMRSLRERDQLDR
jgi:hypothetical protein